MKVLVIGASGFLGKTVYHLLKEAGDDVIGTYNSKPVEGMQQLDVLDVDGLLSLLDDFQPDAIIWTVMNHKLEEEIADKVMPKLCQHIGAARLIFLSTSVALEEKMSSSDFETARTAGQRYKEISEALESKYARWEELAASI